MARRTKYTVRGIGIDGRDVGKFSNLRHAMLFAIARSEDHPSYLIEIDAKNGLAGQYQGGKPTPEFEQHHIVGIFH